MQRWTQMIIWHEWPWFNSILPWIRGLEDARSNIYFIDVHKEAIGEIQDDRMQLYVHTNWTYFTFVTPWLFSTSKYNSLLLVD